MKTRERMAVAAEHLTLFQDSGLPLYLGLHSLEQLKELEELEAENPREIN